MDSKRHKTLLQAFWEAGGQSGRNGEEGLIATGVPETLTDAQGTIKRGGTGKALWVTRGAQQACAALVPLGCLNAVDLLGPIWLWGFQSLEALKGYDTALKAEEKKQRQGERLSAKQQPKHKVSDPFLTPTAPLVGVPE